MQDKGQLHVLKPLKSWAFQAAINAFVFLFFILKWIKKRDFKVSTLFKLSTFVFNAEMLLKLSYKTVSHLYFSFWEKKFASPSEHFDA